MSHQHPLHTIFETLLSSDFSNILCGYFREVVNQTINPTYKMHSERFNNEYCGKTVVWRNSQLSKIDTYFMTQRHGVSIWFDDVPKADWWIDTWKTNVRHGLNIICYNGEEYDISDYVCGKKYNRNYCSLVYTNPKTFPREIKRYYNKIKNLRKKYQTDH